jgi:hypothetical protein
MGLLIPALIAVLPPNALPAALATTRPPRCFYGTVWYFQLSSVTSNGAHFEPSRTSGSLLVSDPASMMTMEREGLPSVARTHPVVPFRLQQLCRCKVWMEFCHSLFFLLYFAFWVWIYGRVDSCCVELSIW